MTALPKTRFSEDEYLALERAAEYKSEYCDGEIFATAGAGGRHGLISWNIGGLFYTQFKGRPCLGYINDMRVRAADSGLYSYPDVIALCGEPKFLDEKLDTLLNPQLLVEVLSPSTANYEHGEKFRRYRRLESLTDYLLVSQDRAYIDHWSRDPSAPHVWSILEYSRMSDRIHLASLDVYLTVADVYHQVEFPAGDQGSPR